MSVTGDKDAKIQFAVEKCMAYVHADRDSPIRRVIGFLHLLAASPDWSESEIRDVTNRVLASLAEDTAADNPRAAFPLLKDR